MPRRTLSAPIESKTKQIFTLLREQIFQGVYPAGVKLPSTRDLANEFGVSRALIVDVFEQLIAEGYLEGRQGSGSYVVDLGGSKRQFPSTLQEIDVPEASVAEPPARFQGIDFRPSFPALEYIPFKRWKETAIAAFANTHSGEFGYDEDPAGHWQLRANICRLLLHTKGIRCQPSQVVITAGATQAISLLTRLLLKPGDAVAIEDPSATFIQHIFASTGADLIPVPVDEHGLRVDDMPTLRHPKCVFVTPSHQFPLGSILSIGRRMQLLDYARQTGCYIIEDDYDSEFRYTGMPIHALRELDAERIVYVGTFSKNLFPALRIGYMVVPQELLTPLLRLKKLTDMHCPTLPQITLARFISQRHLEHHIARMKRIYSKRRKCLIAGLANVFGSGVKISGDAAGLHLVAEMAGSLCDSQVAAQLEERHIRIYPAERYTIVKGRYEDRLIMGFGNLEENNILEGTKAIAKVLRHRL
ncbi:GntR family transcriptional regulator / MocR family aminotransferase [Paenibacillus sp. UNC496MF]|uniref:MocR-like pyridoxine biosynthesis transcription factor PdxR n=1 Tax=Paenibacillus sp. UNC496MF TaxID=1502753 RepID=UPI0008DFCA7D|nr:PLP-dependent aminotransferase family protein [Paenibacillus sp. UNC496MF]SFJ30796.1 GntR family transcriptional regulator / MocR family aminotransferase [Paenibacillus sp. UNC496MF]